MSSKKNASAVAKAEKALALVNDVGLTQTEAAEANVLLQMFPGIKPAIKELREAEVTLKSRFWSFVEVLRLPVRIDSVAQKEGSIVVPARDRTLSGDEITLALLALGEPKQRVTEWRRIATMDAETYRKCRLGELSKIEALGVARGALLLEEKDGKIEAVKKETEEKPDPAKPLKAKYHKMPKAIQTAILAATEPLRATDDEIPYELEIETADGREMLIRIFVDSKPVSTK